MQKIKVLSFQDAVHDSASLNGRHALFCTTLESRCTELVFGGQAGRGVLGLAEYIQEVCATFSDRDVVGLIDSIRKTSELLGVYDDLGDALAFQLRKDSDFLRDLLASTVLSSLSGYLPRSYDALTDQGFGACLQFARNFNSVYSQNFDMVPVWAQVQSNALRKSNNLIHNFTIKPDREPVVAVGEPGHELLTKFWFLAEGQSDSGSSILPEQALFLSARIRLVDLIRKELAAGSMPNLDPREYTDVSLASLQHRAYLDEALQAFSTLKGGLFLFVRNRSELDESLAQRLQFNDVEKVYLAIFDDIDSPETLEMINFLRTKAKGDRSCILDVVCFDAESVWEQEAL